MIDERVLELREIAEAVSRFLNEHGYAIRYDKDTGYWRIVLQGIDPKDDTYYSGNFATLMRATYRALQLANGETR